MVDLISGQLILYQSQYGDETRSYKDLGDLRQIIIFLGYGSGKEQFGYGCSGLIRGIDFHAITKMGIRNLTFVGIVRALDKFEFLKVKQPL